MSLIEINTWSNWSGFQQSHPEYIKRPEHLHQLQDIVMHHDKVRVVGAGHSFTPLVATDQTLISLDDLSGVIHVDEAKSQSTLWSGTRLYDLGALLEPYNQALMNQGDIDQQSIAGAVSTGTHGTGIDLHCLSGYVEAFELLSATGELLTCSREQNSEIFEAGRVSLGAFGVFTKITMQNRPRYKLKESIHLAPVEESIDAFLELKNKHRHIEFFIFPFTNRLIFKTLDETTDEINPRKESKPSEDILLKWCCEISRRFPFITPYLQKLVGIFVQPSCFVDWSSQIFATPRLTKFNEMEYQVPLEHGVACIKEVIATFKKHAINAFFPIEFRVVKADDIWLSPFYQQDCISISVHQYHKQDPYRVFDLIEPIFKKYQARPHWAKMHQLRHQDLKACYPKWDDFLALRQELDPSRKFLNPYLEQLFLTRTQG